jgi:hypothetical protein
MAREQGSEVDVDELVAVQGEDVSVLFPRLGCEAQAASPSERLRLPDDDELDAEVGQRLFEEPFVSGRAGDDHAVDVCAPQEGDLIRGERLARNRDERLRLSSRGRAEPLGLAAGQDQGFHRTYERSSCSRSRSSVSGRVANGEAARPIPS